MSCMLHATVATCPRYDVHCRGPLQDEEGQESATAQGNPPAGKLGEWSLTAKRLLFLRLSLADSPQLPSSPRLNEVYWT